VERNKKELLSKEEEHILKHSVGHAHKKGQRAYRNHFVTDENTVDFPHCINLVKKGFMKRGKALGSTVFWVTEEGAKVIGMSKVKLKKAMR